MARDDDILQKEANKGVEADQLSTFQNPQHFEEEEKDEQKSFVNILEESLEIGPDVSLNLLDESPILNDFSQIPVEEQYPSQGEVQLKQIQANENDSLQAKKNCNSLSFRKGKVEEKKNKKKAKVKTKVKKEQKKRQKNQNLFKKFFGKGKKALSDCNISKDILKILEKKTSSYVGMILVFEVVKIEGLQSDFYPNFKLYLEDLRKEYEKSKRYCSNDVEFMFQTQEKVQNSFDLFMEGDTEKAYQKLYQAPGKCPVSKLKSVLEELHRAYPS